MINENNKISLYYGTRNLDLDFKYKIDPNFNGGRIFEFGNGFYLTPNRELAESYIRYTSLFEKIQPDNRPSLDQMIRGINVVGNLHVYKLDYQKLKAESDVKEFEGLDEYKKVLKDTLSGYNRDINYRPDRDATFGEICGKVWDDYWDENNPNRGTLSHDELIEKCVDEMKKKPTNRERQLCIHRKFIGDKKKNIFDEYLKKVSCIEIS